ncbi:SRPBCC family protein [Nocardiopsis sp. NPDC058789]|uniref:SRPBCC family protein n=1 Tax=Nocardiopsis eucommiae TaxID=2831970 RepID=A0A975QJ58_9ACTN|nr:SRPBCC family protein [Nocardiopsis eucommiae]
MAVKVEYDILIDAPYDLVWEVTNDVASWADLFAPSYESVDVIHQEGDTIRFRITKVPDEEGRVMTWVSDRTMDREAGQTRAARVETGPFEFMHIVWDYEQEPEGVRLTWNYEFAVKPECPWSEDRMEQHFDESVPEEMSKVRERIEARARELAETV